MASDKTISIWTSRRQDLCIFIFQVLLKNKHMLKIQSDANQACNLILIISMVRSRRRRRQRGGFPQYSSPDSPDSNQIPVPQFHNGVAPAGPQNANSASQIGGNNLATQGSQSSMDNTVPFTPTKGTTATSTSVATDAAAGGRKTRRKKRRRKKRRRKKTRRKKRRRHKKRHRRRRTQRKRRRRRTRRKRRTRRQRGGGKLS